MKRLFSTTALLFVLLASSLAHAQQVSRPVTVEYFQGPVVSSNRIIGMGGAFIGVAEGADGHLINPASYATRYNYTARDWFDYDWALSWITMPGGSAALNKSPVSVSADQATYLEAGADMRFGNFGVGLHYAPRQFDERISWPQADGSLRFEPVTWEQSAGGLGAGYAFARGQFVVGVAEDITELRLDGLNLTADEAFSVSTNQLLIGALAAPFGKPWRVGARFRTPALGDSTIAGDVEQFRFTLVPKHVVAPWQIGVGGSWRWGERSYNPRYIYDGKKGIEGDRDRRYVLAAADLLVTGTSNNAIGLESFLVQKYRRAGNTLSFAARVGLESEVLANRLRLRAGSYYEPCRYEGVMGRVHATAGADVRVSLGWDWRLNAAVDVANGYFNWGLGVGFWH